MTTMLARPMGLSSPHLTGFLSSTTTVRLHSKTREWTTLNLKALSSFTSLRSSPILLASPHQPLWLASPLFIKFLPLISLLLLYFSPDDQFHFQFWKHMHSLKFIIVCRPLIWVSGLTTIYLTSPLGYLRDLLNQTLDFFPTEICFFSYLPSLKWHPQPNGYSNQKFGHPLLFLTLLYCIVCLSPSIIIKFYWFYL